MPLEEAVWAVLRGIADPEIPALSLVDLGMIRRVSAGSEEEVVVELMPTFLGCPALTLMRSMIEEQVGTLAPVRVEIVRDEAWTTERISEEGRAKLLASGFAPPPRAALRELPVLAAVPCPYCGSQETTLESAFGPTPCRAVHYCRSCRQPFEQIKPV